MHAMHANACPPAHVVGTQTIVSHDHVLFHAITTSKHANMRAPPQPSLRKIQACDSDYWRLVGWLVGWLTLRTLRLQQNS